MKTPLTFIAILACFSASAQTIFIHSKDGRAIFNRKQFILNCLNTLHKDRSDFTAVAICNCQAEKIDNRFTYKQFKKYNNGGLVDLNGLIKEDSTAEQDIRNCYLSTGKTYLLQAESFEDEFIESCITAIRSTTEKSLDSNKVLNFCKCRLQMVKSRKLSDAEMQALRNPNSVLFYEMMYRCGNLYQTDDDNDRNWSRNAAADIRGPEADTINVLSINGMTYIKVKIGSAVQVWLFDTGASDLLINAEMEEALKKENILSQSNYLGTMEYEMANGVVDTCRRYRVNNVQIGGFTVDNVLLAVTDRGKRIIIGKSLLNKFRNWILNNEENKLILFKQ